MWLRVSPMAKLKWLATNCLDVVTGLFAVEVAFRPIGYCHLPSGLYMSSCLSKYSFYWKLVEARICIVEEWGHDGGSE